MPYKVEKVNLKKSKQINDLKQGAVFRCGRGNSKAPWKFLFHQNNVWASRSTQEVQFMII